MIHVYASRLQARGHEVTVVVRPHRRPGLREQLRELRAGRWPARAAPSQTHFSASSYNLHLLEKHRPIMAGDVPDGDVVIATWWETAEWMARLPASKGTKVHFVQHYEAFDNLPKDRVDAVLRMPNAKITISRWLDELLRDAFGNRHVTLIPNSVDTGQFHAPPRTRQRQPTIGMLHHTSPWKDCRTGFAAFERFRSAHPEARLVTFGTAAPTAELPLPAGAENVTLPAQDRIREIYAQCDVWLCTSLSEGFGLPILEAMACRCPAISTPIGGPKDLITEGVDGFFVPAGDAAAMAARLEAFFAMDEAQWQAMSDAACAKASGYSWDDATRRFERALEEAVAFSRV
ncbi:MAG: glycosyltransferase family 4 protein [Sphingomonadales bacterium]|nr:glycosyltransferase family 4 protein [Sphingomonadales bacterium]